jgi:predicted nuclease with TOPRIM domain
MQTSVNELNTQINTLTTNLNTANETITTLNTQKTEIETKFNVASETIVALNSKVEELTPLVEQFNSEKLEKSINEKKEYYSVKFKAVNADEKFNTEEIQNLIKVSINETDEGKNAILSLNSMLVDLVQLKIEDKIGDKNIIKEFSSKNENLIPTTIDFDSRYGA